MASKTLVFLAFFASTVSMILSIPQLQLAVQPPQEPQQPEPEVPVNPNAPADNVPLPLIPLPRTFGSLFNLSAYLANAPANESALNFIPLITLLTAKG